MSNKGEQLVVGILYPGAGALTALSIGSMFLQGLGALALGAIGAIGGWLINKFVIPRLNKLVK